MGIFAGWREIRDNEELIGVITHHERNGGLFGDGDWILKIRPDASHRFLLTNSQGITNADGLVECEVEPTDSIDNDEMEEQLFGPLARFFGPPRGGPAANPFTVTVTGTLVEDLAHDGKTEIHPITSIFADFGTVNQVKMIEFFVFSDDSGNVTTSVRHSGENREGIFRTEYPPTPAVTVVVPQFSETELTEMAEARLIQPVRQGNQFFLEGRIRSGIAPRRGFYHAVIRLWFDSVDLDVRGLQLSPAKRFARTNGVWSIRYDVQAELVLSQQSRSGIVLQNVAWRFQRRDQPDSVSNANPVLFADVELTRGADRQLDYHPQLAAEAALNIPGSAPVSILRVLDLKRPQVALEVVAPPLQGVLSAHVGPLKKVVWQARYRATTRDFVNPAGLSYQWTVEPIPPDASNPAEVRAGQKLTDQDFAFEYALPNKNTYLYKLSLVVTDEHGIEQGVAICEINLPRPHALILAARPLAELRAPTPTQNGLYRLEGRVAASSFYGNLAYRWAVTDNHGWAVSNQGPADRDIFSFDFEYSYPLADFPPEGPVVEVTVTDEAGQVAQDAVDVSFFVPGVGAAHSRAFQELMRLLKNLRDPTPRGFPSRPPISERMIDDITQEINEREDIVAGLIARVVQPGDDAGTFVKDVSQFMQEFTLGWKGRNGNDRPMKSALVDAMHSNVNRRDGGEIGVGI